MRNYEFVTEHFAFNVRTDLGDRLQKKDGAVVVTGRYMMEALGREDRSRELLDLLECVLSKYGVESLILESAPRWFHSAVGRDYKENLLSNGGSLVVEYRENKDDFQGILHSLTVRKENEDHIHNFFI